MLLAAALDGGALWDTLRSPGVEARWPSPRPRSNVPPHSLLSRCERASGWSGLLRSHTSSAGRDRAGPSSSCRSRSSFVREQLL
jgi:hypothetical protein